MRGGTAWCRIGEAAGKATNNKKLAAVAIGYGRLFRPLFLYVSIADAALDPGMGDMPM